MQTPRYTPQPEKKKEEHNQYSRHIRKSTLLGGLFGLFAVCTLGVVGLFTFGTVPLLLAGVAATGLVVGNPLALVIGLSGVVFGVTLLGLFLGALFGLFTYSHLEGMDTKGIHDALGIRGNVAEMRKIMSLQNEIGTNKDKKVEKEITPELEHESPEINPPEDKERRTFRR